MRRPAASAFSRRWPLLGLLALLAAFTLLPGANPARAQTPTSGTLISNTGQADSHVLSFNAEDYALPFTTGANTFGYKLTSVEIRLGAYNALGAPRLSYTASIRKGSGTSVGSSVGSLTNPNLDAGTVSFSSASGIDLEPDTSYFVVFDISATGNRQVWFPSTASHDEDSGGAEGWTIGDRFTTRAYNTSTWALASERNVVELSIKGAVKPPPPVVSSATVDGTTLEVVFDKNLDPASVPAGGDFLVASRGEGNGVWTVTVADATLTLTLAREVGAAETILLYYTRPAAGALRDADGNEVASFSRQAVTNATGSGTPAITDVALVSKPRHDADDDDTNETYPVDQPIVVDVTWDADVTWDTSATSAELQVSLGIGSNTRTATLVTGGETSGTARTLRFSYTVVAGDSDSDGVTVGAGGGDSTSALVVLHSGATLTNAKGTQNAGLTHAGLAADSSHQVKGSVAAVANTAPAYSGSPLTTTAPPQNTAAIPVARSDFSDADGDPLTFTQSANRGDIHEYGTAVYFPTVLGGLVTFRAKAACVLANLAPAPTSPLSTVVTLTASDPDGASVSTTATFETAFTCPSLSSAAVDRQTLTLTLDGVPSAPSYAPADEAPAASDFSVIVDGTAVELAETHPVAVSDPMAADHTITLTLARRVTAGSTVTVSYAPGDYPVAVAFADRAVTNNTRPPPVAAVDANSGKIVTLTFSQGLTAPSQAVQRTMRYTFSVQGAYYLGAEVRNQAPLTLAISGSTMTLTLGAPIPAGQPATVGYSRSRSSSANVRFADGEVVENFTVVATRPGSSNVPLLLAAQVEGPTLTLTFDQELDAGSAPAGSRFRVGYLGASRWGAGTATVSGTRVLVTLSSAVPQDQLGRRTLEVWYDPRDDANPLRAASAGPLVKSISGFRADGISQADPTLDSAIVAGTGLTLYYSEALDTGSTPATGDFTVTVNDGTNPVTVGVSDVAVSATAVTLTLASSVAADHTATLDYTAGANPIQDLAGLDAADLSGQAVTNKGPTDPGAPALAATTPAAVAGWGLTLSFDQPLDPATVPDKAAFTLSNSWWSVHSVTVRGQKLELGLSWSVHPCARRFTVSYAKPSDGALRSVWGADVATFSDQTVTYGGTGTCMYGWEDSWTGSVILRGTRPFAQDAPPQPQWFTVSATGGPVTVTGAAFHRRDPELLVLTVSREFAGHELITVSYTRPPGEPGVWNVDGDQLADLTDMLVRNRVGTPAVTAVNVVSDAGGDDTYAAGEVIRVALTFSRPVEVVTTGGTPHLTIDMDPADWGAKRAAYESGSGANRLVFAHTVVEPNFSTQGIAVLADSLALDGGVIRSALNGAHADLDHPGLAHDPAHQVDWRLPPPSTPPGVNQAPVFVGAPPGRVLAPSATLVSLPASQADFRDPDGDPLTFTLSASRDDVHAPGFLTYSEPTKRIFFMANTECALAALDPPLPATYDTVVTMTATDPHGASAQITATFRTGRAGSHCPSLASASVDGASLTLAFDGALAWAYDRTPAAEEFAVTVDGQPVSLADADPVSTSGDTISLTLASPVRAGQAVTVSYAASHSPVAAAFADRPVTNETPAPAVTAVAVTSDAGDDATYGPGDTIRVTVTFGEAVDVSGTPRLKLKMDPGYGEKWAAYEGGGGTAALTFTHTVVEPNLSPQGIAVLGDTLELNGGAIASAATASAANLAHTGLAHDPNHKVDWQRSSSGGGAPATPTVDAVAIVSDPGDDATYGPGDVIRIQVTFSAAVDVSGSPRLKLKMDPGYGEKWAAYEGGSGTTALTFTHTVVEPNLSPQGVAVLADTLELNGGSIAASSVVANLSHPGLPHDAAHKVDWQP